jgi:hypothetical protein
MFLLDIDFRSEVNTVHKIDCIHVVPENHPEKELGKIGESGGYLDFATVGEAVRYLKTQRIPGIISHCSYCKPTKKFNPEPAAALRARLDSPVVQMAKKAVEVTETKSIAKRLSERLFGSR